MPCSASFRAEDRHYFSSMATQRTQGSSSRWRCKRQGTWPEDQFMASLSYSAGHSSALEIPFLEVTYLQTYQSFAPCSQSHSPDLLPLQGLTTQTTFPRLCCLLGSLNEVSIREWSRGGSEQPGYISCPLSLALCLEHAPNLGQVT